MTVSQNMMPPMASVAVSCLVNMVVKAKNTAAQAGITLNLSVATGAQTLARYRDRELQVTLEAWGPDYPDPQTNASTFAYNPGNADEDQNTGILAWRNAYDPGALTQKTKDAVLEKDTETRRKMYEEIQQTFLETAPFVIMFQETEIAAMRGNVNNLVLGPSFDNNYYRFVTKD